MLSVGFDPSIPASERPQTNALEQGHWDRHEGILRSESITPLFLKLDTRWVVKSGGLTEQLLLLPEEGQVVTIQ
jgi:hypothetical protein